MPGSGEPFTEQEYQELVTIKLVHETLMEVLNKERELRDENPALQDLYEQYQAMLNIVAPHDN